MILESLSLLIEEELIEFLADVLQGDLSVHLFLELLEGPLAVVVVVEVVEHEFGTFFDLRVQILVVVVCLLQLPVRQLHLLHCLIIPVVELRTEVFASDFVQVLMFSGGGGIINEAADGALSLRELHWV